jgi:preprotein translocase subunit SecF
MKVFELIPSGTNLQFVKHRWRFISVSILLLIGSLVAMLYRQATTDSILNFGIDFAGGSQVQLALSAESEVSIDDLRVALDEFGYEGGSAVTVPDKDNEVLVRVKETLSIDEQTLTDCEAAAGKLSGAGLVSFSHPADGNKLFLSYDAKPNLREVERVLGDAGCIGTADKGAIAKEGEFSVDVALIGIGAKLRDQLDQRFGAGTVDHIVRAETVGAKVGSQLKTDGVKSMLYAIGFIFLFVMIRFDLRFAPGGIVALTHDAFIVVGAFALTGKEFNLQTIAAVLTIIGYSINDTIVVFDRVRERVALHRDEPIEETTNAALNDTLSRTVLTSTTTILVVAGIYVMGSGPIKDFAFALLVGLVVGTYSSLYIATPVFLWVNRRFYQGQGHLKWVDEEDREGTGTLLGGEAAAPGLDDDGTADAVPTGDAVVPRKPARRRRRRRPGALAAGTSEKSEDKPTEAEAEAEADETEADEADET